MGARYAASECSIWGADTSPAFPTSLNSINLFSPSTRGVGWHRLQPWRCECYHTIQLRWQGCSYYCLHRSQIEPSETWALLCQRRGRPLHRQHNQSSVVRVNWKNGNSFFLCSWMNQPFWMNQLNKLINHSLIKTILDLYLKDHSIFFYHFIFLSSKFYIQNINPITVFIKFLGAV